MVPRPPKTWVALAAAALLLVSGPILASLTVEIVTPASDPFEVDAEALEKYEAVAYQDGIELPPEEVEWEWDFGDSTDHRYTNPTAHRYTSAGYFTLSATATVGQAQATDSAQAQVAEEPEEPELMTIYFSSDAQTIWTGSVICDNGYFLIRTPPNHSCKGWYLRNPGSAEWGQVSGAGTNCAPPGADYAEFRQPHMNLAWKNLVAFGVRVELEIPGMPPTPVSVERSFNPYNTVGELSSADIILHDPEDAEWSSHSISWSINHADPPLLPTNRLFSVCVKVFDCTGGQVWHTHVNDQGPESSGSVTWEGELHPPPQMPDPPTTAPKGVYTSRVLVTHGTLGEAEGDACAGLEDAWASCCDKDKSWELKISDVSVANFLWGLEDYPHRASVSLHYALSATADTLELRLYKPSLGPGTILSVSPDPLLKTAGHHDCTVEFEVAPQDMGNYRFVLFAKDTQEIAEDFNRDMHPKHALPKGAVQAIWPPACNCAGTDAPGKTHFADAAAWARDALLAGDGATHYAAHIVGAYAAGLRECMQHHGAIVSYSGHGQKGTAALTLGQTAGEGMPVPPNSIRAYMAADDPADNTYGLNNFTSMSHCLFVLLAACHSARPDDQGNSLVQRTAQLGADAVIGFGTTVKERHIAFWEQRFWHYTMAGEYSTADAIEPAIDDLWHEPWVVDDGGVESCVPVGDVWLLPAKFGCE